LATTRVSRFFRKYLSKLVGQNLLGQKLVGQTLVDQTSAAGGYCQFVQTTKRSKGTENKYF
jgi:hypothetical protein